MESSIVMGLTIVVSTVIWCLFFAVCVLEINGRGKRIDQTSDEYLKKNGTRPVIVYEERRAVALAIQMSIMTAGLVLTILISFILSTANPGDIIDPIIIFIFFFFFAAWEKMLITISVRTLFVITDEGIEQIRLNRKGYKAITSIRWADVTAVDGDAAMYRMNIDTAHKRIMLKSSW